MSIYFTHKMTISQYSWECSHYDVIVRSYINGLHLFWYQWKEDVHTYTLVVNLGLYNLQYWSRGLQQPPFRKYVWGKNTLEEQANWRKSQLQMNVYTYGYGCIRRVLAYDLNLCYRCYGSLNSSLLDFSCVKS